MKVAIGTEPTGDVADEVDHFAVGQVHHQPVGEHKVNTGYQELKLQKQF
jgi:hypothetical protein